MPRGPEALRIVRAHAQREILDASMTVFGDRGFAEATTAEVARRAGVSKGLVFNYFPTKTALLEALLERTFTEILDFWDAQPWNGPPRAQLRMFVERALSQVARRPGFYRLYFSLALQPGGSAALQRVLTKIEERLKVYLDRTTRLFEVIGSSEPATDAKLFQAAINGIAQAMVTTGETASSSELVPLGKLTRRLLARFGADSEGEE